VLLSAALPGAAQTAAPGGVIVHEQQGLYRVTARFTVAAPPAVVLEVLTDYENIPRFMREVTRSVVRERAPGSAVVEQEAQARVMLFSKTIHLLLAIREQAQGITFVDTSGRSFTAYAGGWGVTGGPGDTTVVYELEARPAFDVPKFILVRALRNDSTRMIERLRAEITARGQAAAALPAGDEP
jgi:hypothetical protein